MKNLLSRSNRWRQSLIFILLPAVALQIVSRGLNAGPPPLGLLLFVNTTSDAVVAGACTGGLPNCSLRGAIEASNSNAGEDGIEFDLPAGSVINLTSALPAISDTITIAGPGASLLTVRRDSSTGFRIFKITASGPVALSGMTITNGSTDLGDRDGGGVQNTNAATVSINGCVIKANFANQGGGVDNHSTGTINLTNTTISENGADVNGGIFNQSSGTVNITNCAITGNTANRFGGGGIYNSAGTVNVAGTLISQNRSQLRGGGGIKSLGGSFTVTSSTISENTDELDDGGGIYNFGGTFTLTNCTISGNSTPQGGGGGIANFSTGQLNVSNCTFTGNSQGSDQTSGGALRNEGTAIVRNSTFSGNSALTEGGAIANTGTFLLTNSTVARNSATGTTHSAGDGAGIRSNAGFMQIKSTIVALNTGPGASPDVAGGFSSNGFNLIGKIGTATGFDAATDQKGTVAAPLDPKLAGSLQDNGGPTRTLALLFDSPALDRATSVSLVGTLTTDQRGLGFPRTIDNPSISNAAGGDGTDVGAFESHGTARGDFNSDSFTDYLLFNASTHRTAIWNLHGTEYLGGVYGPTLPAGWTVACVADLNLDGKPDYVLFDASTRRTAIWYLNNAARLSSAYGPTLPAGYAVIAATDFNSDGQPDYVLFNASTHRVAIWFLNAAATFIGSAYGPTPPAGWILVDALDFNSNGKPDLLISNASTGRTAIWYLNGTNVENSLYGPTLLAGWTLSGAADFNSDSMPDYVLLNVTTRRTALWFLNGASRSGSAYGPTLSAGYILVSP